MDTAAFLELGAERKLEWTDWVEKREAAEFRETVAPVPKPVTGSVDSDYVELRCVLCLRLAWSPKQAKCAHAWCSRCLAQAIAEAKNQVSQPLDAAQSGLGPAFCV